MNERKAEGIVRRHFENDTYYKDNRVIFEEQLSDSNIITKLLKNASKSGEGQGKPEFIIRYKDDTNFLIVVECKANIKKHISNIGNNYKDYAIDGVKLYASYLSKEFDVLAVAVSGIDKNNLKINHYLQLKGTSKAEPIFDNKFLSLEAYLEGYKKDDRKFKQDFSKLLYYSKELNDKLHSLKVKESQRSLLIAGALIALSDKSFRNSFEYEVNYKKLTDNFLNAISIKLNDVSNPYIEEIVISYSFLKTHTILSRDLSILKNLIKEIDDKINSFIKNYKYFDTLGQFYIEFLRYANNDKGLGIVLTPPHITELFCNIANVNKDSIILDNCVGTGGFLISGMQKMIKDSAGDNNKEYEIKKNQIIGIEYQDDIFTLLCSNMFIHGDGRSNLFKGSCFDEAIIEEVKKIKPNVGFLNPPYKNDKNDKEEIEFILNNLSMLEKGSYCVAIVPMSCALAQSGDRLALKERLLENHTLEAVFSMPNELFFNSKVGVNTCVMIFIAREKHPQNYKTYFGYWKEDGFIKRKANGRSDYNNVWDSIKAQWIKNYRNKDEIVGHSVKKEVKASDEWCVEAYMETDYIALKKEIFEKEIFKYSIFLLSNLYLKNIVDKFGMDKNIKLDVRKWQGFKLSDLFEVTGTKSIVQRDVELYGRGEYPYVVTSAQNNGVSGFYNYWTEEGNVLTIDSATVGTCFYQNRNFSASDHVEKLMPKFTMNSYIAIFFVGIINLEQYKYGYGRKFAQKRIKETIIKLPVSLQGEPDFKFMGNYIKSLPYSGNL